MSAAERLLARILRESSLVMADDGAGRLIVSHRFPLTRDEVELVWESHRERLGVTP